MSEWFSRNELDALLADALAQYDSDVCARWGAIRIQPEKWSCSPWADDTAGFWAVAIEGDRVLWFNDIEEGFNWSRFSLRGTIDEYWCNQTRFAEILERFARELSALARARVPEAGVPPDLAPGTIVARQTTYWDVRLESGTGYRIHFRDEAETAFADSAYSSVELTAHHPLLVQYDEPMQSLYFLGTPTAPRVAAESAESAIRDVSASWRGLRDYSRSVNTLERMFRSGHGLLMHAPQSVCVVVARSLEADGIGASIVGVAEPRPGLRALLLGRSYVIARGFAFEPHRR